MPFGISSGPEVYQKTLEFIFEGYPCVIIMDEIRIHGTCIEEHDSNLKKILARAREMGLKLNQQKCKFRVNQVAYIGEGIKSDPKRI